MPQAGFYCTRNGEQKNLNDCLTKCEDRCLSIPLLRSIWREPKKPIPNRYSVTEILNPPQIVYLSRNFDYYCFPLNLVWRTYGSAVHSILEPYGEDDEDETPNLGDRFIGEKKKEIAIDGVTLVGKPDLYDINEDILWDYKLKKAYAVKKLKHGDFKTKDFYQTNIYAGLFFPKTKKIMLECIVSDWTRRVQKYDKLNRVEDIEVPILPTANINYLVKECLRIHKAAQDSGEFQPCSYEDVWFSPSSRSEDFGIPIRCRDFCDLSEVCNQYFRFKEGEENVYPERKEFIQSILEKVKI